MYHVLYHVLALHSGLEQFQRVELPDALRLLPSVRKSGRTSAPRLPQTVQVNSGSMSDSLTSSSHCSALIATEWLHV